MEPFAELFYGLCIGKEEVPRGSIRVRRGSQGLTTDEGAGRVTVRVHLGLTGAGILGCIVHTKGTRSMTGTWEWRQG